MCEDPEDPSQGSTTFWVYFVIRILGTFFLASSFTMMVSVDGDEGKGSEEKGKKGEEGRQKDKRNTGNVRKKIKRERGREEERE